MMKSIALKFDLSLTFSEAFSVKGLHDSGQSILSPSRIDLESYDMTHISNNLNCLRLVWHQSIHMDHMIWSISYVNYRLRNGLCQSVHPSNKSLNSKYYWTSTTSLTWQTHKLDLELKNLFDAAVLYEYWIDTFNNTVISS